jgi:hypothetical protein
VADALLVEGLTHLFRRAAALERHGGGHIAAKLDRRHGVEQRPFAPQHADAGRAGHLVAGEDIKVGAQIPVLLSA